MKPKTKKQPKMKKQPKKRVTGKVTKDKSIKQHVNINVTSSGGGGSGGSSIPSSQPQQNPILSSFKQAEKIGENMVIKNLSDIINKMNLKENKPMITPIFEKEDEIYNDIGNNMNDNKAEIIKEDTKKQRTTRADKGIPRGSHKEKAKTEGIKEGIIEGIKEGIIEGRNIQNEYVMNVDEAMKKQQETNLENEFLRMTNNKKVNKK